ncbi:MAG: T9SS type A sorting domain-containing protein [Bacteroidia bacterium]|nr:T9SS type A sorting domain-containing protein [Bacteroidia bacterium]
MIKKNLKYTITLLIFLFYSGLLNAQNFILLDSVSVIHSGKKLTSAWAGGLNSVQFSEIDLDNDGKQDLFVFDRSGNRITTYLNRGGKDTVKFIFAYEYISKFPVGITDWCLLRDINCDGKPDILCSAGNGIKIYYNTTTNGQLNFTLATPMLNSNFGGGLITNLYVSRMDIPVIDDMDGDGDLDVLTFPTAGTRMEYHRNYSIENSGTCSLLDFKLEDPCWGKVEEDANSNAVYLNISCRGGSAPPEDQSVLHSGSTIFSFDSDGDGDMDVVLGDISFSKVDFLLNGGNKLDALITQQDTAFPAYNVPIDLPVFPALYSVDVNNDGQKDVIASPNDINESNNIMSVWYYKDIDTSKAVHLSLQQKDFLQDQMIDVGENAYPVFFDYNSDGLMDLIIGCNTYTQGRVKQSKLVSYKNIGTITTPEFLLDNTDYANLLQQNLTQSLAPCFGDLDYDGDADMLLGCNTGEILYFENTAIAGSPANFILRSNKYLNIDIGNFSKPTLFDIDNNGRLDLIIGGSDGKLTYYSDTATSGAAAFKFIRKNFGLVNIPAQQGSSLGYASPLFIKENNQTVLYVGTFSGPIIKYQNIDNNLNGIFTVANDTVGGIVDGFKTHLSIADINNDEKPEMVVGNIAGGIRLYKMFPQASSIYEEYFLKTITLFPNPCFDNIIFKGLKNSANYQIINLQGNKVQQGVAYPNQPIVINNLSSGLYFIKVSNNYTAQIFKLIKR